MSTKTLFMETTCVEADKTAGEIVSCLVSHGARQIAMEYNDKKEVVGLQFLLMVCGQPQPFKLPARIDPVFKILNGRRRFSHERALNAVKDRSQATRVAWRQVLRWVQAQMAMIDTGMVEAHEVFSPYWLNQNGQTLFEVLSESKFKALPAPQSL